MNTFEISGQLVDVHLGEIYPAKISVAEGRIQSIDRLESAEQQFLMPGFVDSHIHIESSMLLPAEFARVAVTHGTVATVSDPHEIANVCGMEGVELMLRNAAESKFKFCFGAPSCVPATEFETSGAKLNVADVKKLLNDPRIGYLSEVMDFPGVLNKAPAVMAKIKASLELDKPVDGHAPGLRAEQATAYVSSGITTDHECVSRDEAIDKLKAGCKIAIREGSAARNFDALQSLIDDYPENCMLCSDDKHPDELLVGHIDRLVARAVAAGSNLMNVLRVACMNPVQHYNMDVGLLRVGDPADFIVVDNLTDFRVRQTYLDGELAAENGKSLLTAPAPKLLNNLGATSIRAEQLEVPATGKTIRVMQAIDGQLITNSLQRHCLVENGLAVPDIENDILKIVVVNRYKNAPPSVAFVNGFGLRQGAFASTVAHDSHNVVAVGTNDEDLESAINGIILQGGLSVANDSVRILPLTIGGLMSGSSCEIVAKHYSKVDQRVKSELGSSLRAPFMTLSFMALLVIPSLKLSDKGLFDVDRFEFTSLFVD